MVDPDQTVASAEFAGGVAGIGDSDARVQVQVKCKQVFLQCWELGDVADISSAPITGGTGQGVMLVYDEWRALQN